MSNDRKVTPERPSVDQGSPRERTLSRMYQLVAKATAGSALVASCGFLVVDPVPPPSRCAAFVPEVKASAVWRKDGDTWVIELKIERPPNQPAYTLKEGKAADYQGTILKQEITPDGTYTATLKPLPDQSSMYFLVPVHCGEDASLNIGLTWRNKKPSEGEPVDVELRDYR